MSQEIAAPEEDDVPQDMRDQTAAMAKRGVRCKRVLVLLSEVSSLPSPPENASLLCEELKGKGEILGKSSPGLQTQSCMCCQRLWTRDALE